MAKLTRRAALGALAALATGGAVAVGYGMRNIFESPTRGLRFADGGGMMGGGMMGVDAVDMSRYMDMFNRHTEITRTVEEIPGGIRTTTQSDAPDLAAQLHAHVTSMYAHLDHGAEVSCMSQSLPILFRNAGGYHRQLTFTPTGVIAEETADDPNLTKAIRTHAQEVSGFVHDGMPAMMKGMMGPGMMGPH